jgi:hypothetical protein
VGLQEPIPLTRRLLDKVARDFAESDRRGAVHALERVDLGSWRSTRPPDGRERVLTAVLVLAHGDDLRLWRAVRDAERDWRDVLMAANLANGDWPAQVDKLLGPG